MTETPAHGAVFNLCQNLKVTALHTPCHTEDSICFFVEDGDERVVFTGDTLFHGGMLLSVRYPGCVLNPTWLWAILRGLSGEDGQGAE